MLTLPVEAWIGNAAAAVVVMQGQQDATARRAMTHASDHEKPCMEKGRALWLLRSGPGW